MSASSPLRLPNEARLHIREASSRFSRNRRGGPGTFHDSWGLLAISLSGRDKEMDKDRVKGSAQQAKGAVKEVAGKVTGDAKLKNEGKADKTAGKIRNAIGGLKDALRGK